MNRLNRALTLVVIAIAFCPAIATPLPCMAAEPDAAHAAALAKNQYELTMLKAKLAAERAILKALIAHSAELSEEGGDEGTAKEVKENIERHKKVVEELMGTLASMESKWLKSDAGDVSQNPQELVDLVGRYEEALRAANARSPFPAAPLPVIVRPQIAVYRLSHVAAPGIGAALVNIFGNAEVRVAIGDDPKTLIVVATQELADDVKQLVQSLDIPQHSPDASAEVAEPPAKANPRSLLVRIFWVADHLPDGEGQELSNFLPTGVIEAFENLGLEGPRVVTQTINSVARPATDRSTEPISFATTTLVVSPSIAATQLKSKGIATLNSEGRVDLNVEIELSGGTNCQVAGTITAPLGHYVVLGTANSMVLDSKNATAGVVAAATNDGMDGRQGMGFEGGGRGFYGGLGYDQGMGGMPFGGTLPPNMKSSRIAFVVQVIENTSYAMDGNE